MYAYVSYLVFRRKDCIICVRLYVLVAFALDCFVGL